MLVPSRSTKWSARLPIRPSRRYRPQLELLESRIHPAVTITEISTGISPTSPDGITAGPDGNLWFVYNEGSRIGRITPAGVATEFGGMTPNSFPDFITAGPDGNLWFTEEMGNRIGRITPAGVITEFSTGISPGSGPDGITAGPDGNLWFTEHAGSRIGRITTAGVVTEFSTGISPGSGPVHITAGPDGNLWFAEQDGNRIGRITTSGSITEYSDGITANSQPFGITAGPDGNLWFTELNGDRIGQITPGGVVTEVSTGITPGSQPDDITLGPDGNLWFTEFGGSRVGRITPVGVVTEVSGLSANSWPTGIATGPDGNIWFAEYKANQIGRVEGVPILTQTTITTSGSPSASGQTVTFTAQVSAVDTVVTLPLTGSVAFFDDGMPLTTVPLSNGSAAFQTSTLAVGSHPITGNFDGTGNFTDSVSAVQTQVVKALSIVLSGASSVNEGSSYTLTLGTVTDPGHTVTSYLVHWGDGQSDPYTSNGAKRHTYADGPATRTITVDLTDDDGTFPDRGNALSVTVNNVAPTIAISGSSSVNEGSVYTLTLGAVLDPGQDTVTAYIVHWGDGGMDTYSTAGAKTHTYADGPASRSVTVDLTDEDGTFTNVANAFSVTVANVAPTIAISGPHSVNEGSVYTLTLGAVTDPGQDTVTSYIVHWGDALMDTYSTAGSKTHTYADGPATRSITVDLVDEDGTYLNVGNVPLSVTVNNVAPTLSVSGAASVPVGIAYTLTLGAVLDPGQDTVTAYVVHWGDGSSDTYSSAGGKTHSYRSGPATRTITVDLKDEDGTFLDAGTALTVRTVIMPAPPPSFIGTGVLSASVAFDAQGQQVTAAVFTGGLLYLFDSAGVHFIGSSVLSASVAFNPQGQEIIDVVFASNELWSYDPSGAHFIGNSVQSVSVAFDGQGRQVTAAVFVGGGLYVFDAAGTRFVAGNVQSVGLAFDSQGQQVLDLVYSDTTLYQFDSSGAQFIGSGVEAVGAAFNRFGQRVLDVVFASSDLWQF